MATLMDIANALHLNKTTVSKALNNSSDISGATKARVCAEAQRIGYIKPERKKKERRHVIGVICPEIASYYYSQLCTGLTSLLHEKGYEVMVMLSSFSPERERDHLSSLVSLNVSGIIIITEESDISAAVGAVPGADRVPIVIIGLNYTARGHDTVSVDEDYAVQQIVEYLVGQGHRKIAFIGDSLVGKRIQYLKKHLEKHGLVLPGDCIFLSEKRNEECGYDCMNRLLDRPERPTATVAGYDTIALGAYRALSERGFTIPEHMSLISFDDANFCKFLPKAITTVSYDAAAECKVAVAILLSRIHNGNSTFTQSSAIIPKLMIRESTGPCVGNTQIGQES